MNRKTSSLSGGNIMKQIASGEPSGGALGPMDKLTRSRVIDQLVEASFEDENDTSVADLKHRSNLFAWIGVAAAIFVY